MADHFIPDLLVDDSVQPISILKPSEWAEKNFYLTKDLSDLEGYLSYDNSPYTRDIIDCLAPDNPARVIAVMKAAQIGFSRTVIEAGIGWIISECPGNIFYTVGHESLVKDCALKVDKMIDACGLRERGLIRSGVQRARNSKSGDTNEIKEFPMGYLKMCTINHKTLRNISMMYGFHDDWEAVKSSDKKSGSSYKMVEHRYASYALSRKTMYITSPEREEGSNIKPLFNQGDQRRFFIPCLHCEKPIWLQWQVRSEKHPDRMCGMVWEVDGNKALIPETVGYKCYKCEQIFQDKDKMELIRMGKDPRYGWKPTAKPDREEYVSFQISAFYAADFMYGWEHYVRESIECQPAGQPRDEEKYKNFRNLVEGETYETPGVTLSATQLMANIQKYQVNTIPEKLSIAQGNGKIVLLTCAADLGGLVAGINSTHDDVRLDYEVVAWSESGSRYPIDQGSIGTFTPAFMGKRDEAREIWSYDISKPNNVWKIFDKIINTKYEIDGDKNRKLPIAITGIDTGFADHHAFNYIDKSNFTIIGLKGDKDHKAITRGDNTPMWKESSSRSKLYLLKVSKLKDQLVQQINLKWDRFSKDPQPPGFLNFPEPSDGKYLLSNYFEHYESEERKVEEKTGNFLWQKKGPTSQNHFWDIACYHIALRDILMENVFKELKIVNGTWPDFCEWLLNAK